MKNFLSKKILQEYADDSSYARGTKYFQDGCVKELEYENERITATVMGTYLYHVDLWKEDTQLEYSCTCPWYEDTGDFCKHCVAVGLAFLQESTNSTNIVGKRSEQTQKQLSMEDVKKYLESQSKENLVSLIIQHAKDDKRLKVRLIMKAGASSQNVHLPTYRKAIDRAVGNDDYIDYRSMHDYAKGIEDVIESLRDLLEDDHAVEVIELTEYFLERLESQLEMMDDSDGVMQDIMSDIQELHHDACVKAHPDPEKLAQKLFDWEMQNDWEVFYDAVVQYSDVLGERGLNEYRTLAETYWSTIPHLKPNDKDDSFSGKRFRITHIMENLASETGDVEKIVEIKAKDLSYAYSYFTIAELYKKAGKPDTALEWAEKGLRAFPERTDSRLREFLADEYHKRKRHDEAMKLIWKDFTDSRSLERYKLLKTHAERAGSQEVWKEWRERALQFIRERISKEKQKSQKNRWYMNRIDNSELVEIFLWEKDIDAAWTEAQQGGCNRSLWLELAAKREVDFPNDALSVYWSHIEPTIEVKNNQSYRDAIDLLKKVHILLKQLNRIEEWERYVETLRTTHRRKRNFIALLDAYVTKPPVRK